jgi:hypothetical protein
MKSVFARNQIGQGQNRPGDGAHHGAPGPIARAMLSALGIGWGAYWLVKRRRKMD